MEKRVVLAAMLMAGLLMVYQAFFLSSPTEAPQPQKTETQAKTPSSTAAPVPGSAPAPAASSSAGAPAAAPAAGPLASTAPAVPEHTASVEGPLYRAKVISHGGDLQEWE